MSLILEDMSRAQLRRLADEIRREFTARPLLCVECGKEFAGRADSLTCSTNCRVKRKRRGSYPPPLLLTSKPRWIRWKWAKGSKLPISPITGRAVDVTNPAEWHPYEVAKDSTIGDGLGFCLNGDGLACYDLDKVIKAGRITADGLETIRNYIAEPIRFAEISPSGTGLHLWVEAPAAKGIRGDRFERYTQGRYLTVTNRRFSWEAALKGAEIVGD